MKSPGLIIPRQFRNRSKPYEFWEVGDDLRPGEGSNVAGQRKGPVAGVDDKHVIKLQVVKCMTHRRCGLWRDSPLDFKADAASASDDQQVQLRAGMRRPKVALIRSDVKQLDHLFDDRSLP